MNKNIRYLIFFAFIVLQFNVRADENDKIIIAVTKFDAKGADTVWLKHFSNNIRFVNLYNMSMHEAMTTLKASNALLVTGGEDVNPEWYHKGNEAGLCGELDKRRDTLEMAAISLAIQFQMPVLGICRGEQILNVANRGSLIVDIPTEIGTKVSHNSVNGKRATHMVKLERSSRLYGIIQQDSGIVNSSHHQCVERVAGGYSRAATSKDGLTEAIEIKDIDYFVFGVQWHPEGLPEKSPFAYNLGRAFVREASRNLASKKK